MVWLGVFGIMVVLDMLCSIRELKLNGGCSAEYFSF